MTVTIETLGAAYPGFRALPASLTADVSRHLLPFHAAPHSVVRGFDEGRLVPFLLGGALQIALPLSSGRHVPLYTLERGDWCGVAMAPVFGRASRPLQATVRDGAWGGTLPARLVRACLDAQPVLWADAFARVIGRMLDLTDVLGRLAATTVDQRLASLLIERGPHIDATHQGLADELGTAREVVSRALEHFAAEGLVRLGRAHVEVADPRRLAEHQPVAGE
jgi:CRP/FNR family transcriptional regulator